MKQVKSNNRQQPSQTASLDTDRKNKKFLKSFLSGGIAGICSKTLVAPIERVKYLYITSNRTFSYKSYFSDLAIIIRKNGVLNLWRGNLMNIARIFPYSAIDFAVFDYMRSRFYQGESKTKITLFMCGAVAGICSMSATTPLQFIRLRLAMERDKFSYKNNIGAFRKVFELEGISGFYKGYMASLMGIIIYHGFSFFIFTSLKELVKKHQPESYKKWYVDFLLGGLSAMGQLFSYPLDIIRKRMQGQLLLFQKKEISVVMNYRQLIRSIALKEGYLTGFYKGMSLNLLKAPLASATAWTVKNNLNRYLDHNYDM